MVHSPSPPGPSPPSPSSSQPPLSDLPTADPIHWDALRRRSLAPGGFGSARAAIWLRLLHVRDADCALDGDGDGDVDRGGEAHPDERQIRLDTDRSFVLYPTDDSPADHAQRQHALNALVTALFRRHPGLSYFQGFHDIASVLLLTLPPRAQLPALARLSLHRLRDAMGRTLEPLLGLLRILMRLLRLADPTYAALLESVAPLPYASLSHLLTLFAHDAPSLARAQRIFDYLLARPPLAVVYLAAAVTLARRAEVHELAAAGEEGMVHAVLSGLPEFGDEDEDDDDGDDGHDGGDGDDSDDDDDDHAAQQDARDALGAQDAPGAQDVTAGAHGAANGGDSDEREVQGEHAKCGHEHAPGSASTPPLPSPQLQSADPRDPADVPLPPSPPPTRAPSPTPPPPTALTVTTAPLPDWVARVPPLDPTRVPLPPSPPPSRPCTPQLAPSAPTPAPAPAPTPTSAPAPASASHAPSRPPHAPKPTHSLRALLAHADALLALYPASHPALRLERTLGPASAVRTWREHALGGAGGDAEADWDWAAADADAEAIVVRGVDVVMPADESDEEGADDADADDDAGEDEGEDGDWAEEEHEHEKTSWFHLRRRRTPRPPTPADEKASPAARGRAKKRLPRAHGPQYWRWRRRRDTRQALVGASAVLVLGLAVAVALYGCGYGGGRGCGGAGFGFGFGFGGGAGGGAGRVREGLESVVRLVGAFGGF